MHLQLLLIMIGVSLLVRAQEGPPRAFRLPRVKENEPVDLYVGFYVESLSNLNAASMSFDMDMYLRMSWQDPTLKHNGTGLDLIDDRSTQWMPDLYIMNAMTASFQTVTRDNFILASYPNDRFTENDVRIHWFPSGAIEKSSEISLPEFAITNMTTADCTGVFSYGKNVNGSLKGSFGCLEGRLQFDRSMGYHLVQTYIPTSLIVVISWVSFWIDRSAVPARITLSFTTLLTLATQSSSIRIGLPPVSYAKAIDYWMATCMLFVFGGLLEFAAVNSWSQTATKFAQMAAGSLAVPERRPSRSCFMVLFVSLTGGQTKTNQVARLLGSAASRQTTTQTNRPTVTPTKTQNGHINGDNDEARDDVDKHYYTQLSQDYNTVALRVDNLSRILFPGSFILFVAVYMLHYAVRVF